MNKLKLMAAFAVSFSVTGCAVDSMAFQLASDAISNRVAFGQYTNFGYSKKNTDTDIRQLNLSEPVLLGVKQQQNKTFLVDSLNKNLKPFDTELKQHRITFTLPGTDTVRQSDYFAFITLDMTNDRLQEVGKAVADKNGLVVIKGLKNNSLSETFAAVDIINSQGAKVILAPELFDYFSPKRSPSFVVANVLPNGDYGCELYDGSRCAVFHGQAGIAKPVKLGAVDESKRLKSIKDITVENSGIQAKTTNRFAYWYSLVYRDLKGK